MSFKDPTPYELQESAESRGQDSPGAQALHARTEARFYQFTYSDTQLDEFPPNPFAYTADEDADWRMKNQVCAHPACNRRLTAASFRCDDCEQAFCASHRTFEDKLNLCEVCARPLPVRKPLAKAQHRFGRNSEVA